MSWTIYGILIIFGLFLILMIINPNLSCFGRRIRSPFYPVTRKKKMRTVSRDYKFDLGEQGQPPGRASSKDATKKPKTEDYGFKLD
ncbi:MAG: hypothetical protein H5U05_01720 [Candidatus Aminicenantes bacterium]|nr:hypothetical protein [Candidatus Aminicenantes bacterium]